MNYTLTIYSDDTYTEIERVVEVDELKIPYRVAMTIIGTLDDIDINDTDDLIKWLSGNVGLVDRVIKATFHVSDSELERIDAMEIIETVKDLYRWTINKVNDIHGDKSKKQKRR